MLVEVMPKRYLFSTEPLKFREPEQYEILEMPKITIGEYLKTLLQESPTSLAGFTKSKGVLQVGIQIHVLEFKDVHKKTEIRCSVEQSIGLAIEVHNQNVKELKKVSSGSEDGDDGSKGVEDYPTKRGIVLEVLFKQLRDKIEGPMSADGLTKEKGEWQGGVPSVKGHRYIMNVGERQFQMCWILPPGDGDKSQIAYKACPNIVVELDKDKIGKGGLSDLLYKGIGDSHKSHQILYPHWFSDLKMICGRVFPEDPNLFSILKGDTKLESSIEGGLNNLFVQLKNANLRNSFKLGSGIQPYDSPTPSELQVYPCFYTLFDQFPWETRSITEIIARIIGVEMYAAKLYTGLIPHSGSQYKSSIFIQGAGNSFKTFLLERLADALALTWYADGTFSYNPDVNTMESAFLRVDRAKTGGDVWDDPEGLRRSIFVHWVEEGDRWAPDLPFLKKRTGQDNYTAVAKRKDAKNIPLSAVNIFDSNFTISRAWFSEEAYSRCVPVSVFNPSMKTKLPFENYFAIKASGVGDESFGPYLQVLKKRMRNFSKEIPFDKLRNIYYGCCVLSWVMTYGRDSWSKLKASNSPELSTADRKILDFYRSNVLLGNGMGTLTPISDRGVYNLIPLTLTLVASLFEPHPQGQINLSDLEFIPTTLIDSRLGGGTLKKDEEVTKAVKRANLIVHEVVRQDHLRFFGVPLEISGSVVRGLRMRPQYSHWFSEASIREFTKVEAKSKWLDILFNTLRNDEIDNQYARYLQVLKDHNIPEVPWDPERAKYHVDEEDETDEW